MNSFYAFAFYFGGYLRWERIMNGDEEYTGGAILAVMLSIVFGCFQLGAAGPHVRAVTEGKIAGKLAHDVIDHIPGILPNEAGKLMVNRKTIQGQIEF
jgi:hypothetical protein